MRAIDSPQICETNDYIFNRQTTQNSEPHRSTLTLFVPGIRTDHPHDTVASNNLAVAADALNRCQHFHFLTPIFPAAGAASRLPNYITCVEIYHFARKTMRARLKS
jgi:hypothetical protein